MQVDLKLSGLEDNLSKTLVQVNRRPAIANKKQTGKQYANKPTATEMDRNGVYLDLSLIGNKISEYIQKTTKHKVTSNDIRILYLSGGADAIAYCQLQYEFYDRKNQPDLTPIYLYMGKDEHVMKLPYDPNTGNFNLGSVGQFVESLNNDGFNFRHAIDLVVR